MRLLRIPRWVWAVSVTALALFGWSLTLLIGVAKDRAELTSGIASLRALERVQEGLWNMPTPTEADRVARISACRAAFEISRVAAKSRLWLTDDYADVEASLDAIAAGRDGRDLIDRALGRVGDTLEAIRKADGAASARLGRQWDSLGTLVMIAAALVGCTAIFSARDWRRRQEAEERLRASEERYQNIYRNGPSAIAVWDASGRLADWNRRAGEMFGWTDQEKGRPIVELIADASKAFDELSQDGGPIRRVWASRAADGRELLCEWHCGLVHDARGRVSSIIASALDVTERERSAEALRRSEDRYRRLFESNLIGIIVSLADGSISNANDAFLGLVGYTRAEFDAGLVRWDEMTPAEFRAIDDRALAELAETGVCAPFEKEYFRKDGTRLSILIGAAVFEPDQSSYVCFVLDLSLRREAEAVVVASRGLIEAIRRAHLDFIKHADVRLVCNALLDNLLGLTGSGYGFIAELLKSAEGRPYLSASALTNVAWDEASRDFYQANVGRGIEFHNMNSFFGQVVTTGRPVIANMPSTDPRSGGLPPGHPPLVAFLGLPLYHGATLMGVIGIANRAGGYSEADIAYLEPLLTTCAGLLAAHRAEVCRSRAEAELTAAKEAAERANAAKDRFLAVLSHELRTPLTPVLAAVSAAAVDPSSSPEMRELCVMVGRNVELEARLIDDLLDVSRIGRGLLRLEPAVVDAHASICEVLAICRDDVESAGVEVSLCLEAASHHVEVDPARFQQVLWNLIKNAVKFTPTGGRITIRTGIEAASGVGSATGLVIEVSDTGVGIEPDDLARIFLAFEQGESSRRGRTGGLGLGLAISRSVVEGHGGSLVARSSGRDRGSTFVVELATVPAPATTVPPRATSPSEPRKGLDVVLVEDNKDTLFYLTLLLRNAGHNVRPAATLAAAIESAESASFDLVLSDIELPDGTGLDLIRHLRATRPDRFPAIAMSGFGSDDDVRLSLDAGFSSHLTKPVDFHRLQAEIDRTIRESVV